MTSSSDLPVYAGDHVQSGGNRGDRGTVLPGNRATDSRATDSRATDSEEKKMTSSSDLPVYAGDPVLPFHRSTVPPFYRATDSVVPIPFYRFPGYRFPGYRF